MHTDIKNNMTGCLLSIWTSSPPASPLAHTKILLTPHLQVENSYLWLCVKAKADIHSKYYKIFSLTCLHKGTWNTISCWDLGPTSNHQVFFVQKSKSPKHLWSQDHYRQRIFNPCVYVCAQPFRSRSVVKSWQKGTASHVTLACDGLILWLTVEKVSFWGICKSFLAQKGFITR